MMISSLRWYLRADAKKRLSVDTELAAPYLTQVEASKYFHIPPVLQIVFLYSPHIADCGGE